MVFLAVERRHYQRQLAFPPRDHALFPVVAFDGHSERLIENFLRLWNGMRGNGGDGFIPGEKGGWKIDLFNIEDYSRLGLDSVVVSPLVERMDAHS